jgi:hypothetical protein
MNNQIRFDETSELSGMNPNSFLGKHDKYTGISLHPNFTI